MALVYHAHWESTLPLTLRVALKDQRKISSVSHARCESTLPLTLSLSDSGIYFYPLARPTPRAEYEQTRRLITNRPC